MCAIKQLKLKLNMERAGWLMSSGMPIFVYSNLNDGKCIILLSVQLPNKERWGSEMQSHKVAR